MIIAMMLCQNVQVHVATHHSEGTTESQQLPPVTQSGKTCSYKLSSVVDVGTYLKTVGMYAGERGSSLCSTHKMCRADPCMRCWCPILPLYYSTPTSSSRRVTRKAMKGHARAFMVVIGAPNCTTAFNHRSIVYYLQTTSVLTLYLLQLAREHYIQHKSAAVFATHLKLHARDVICIRSIAILEYTCNQQDDVSASYRPHPITFTTACVRDQKYLMIA